MAKGKQMKLRRRDVTPRESGGIESRLLLWMLVAIATAAIGSLVVQGKRQPETVYAAPGTQSQTLTTPPQMADFAVTCFRFDVNAYFTLTWTDVPEPTVGKVAYIFGSSRSGINIDQVPQGVGHLEVAVSNFGRGQVTFSAQAVYFFDDDDDDIWDFSEEHRTSATEIRSCAPIESTPLVPAPTDTRPAHTRDCRIVGHPDTDRFVTDDQESNYFTDTDDHRKIDGAEVHKVIFRKETAYEFILSGDDCEHLSNPARGLNLFYETTDAPFMDARNGFISIPDMDDDVAPSLLVMALYAPGSSTMEMIFGYMGGSIGSQNNMVDVPFAPSGRPVPEEFDFCHAVKEIGTEPNSASGGYKVDDDGNYQLIFPNRDLSAITWQDSTGEATGHKLLLTYCSRGQGRLFLQDNVAVDGQRFVRSPDYTVRYSRLAVELDDTPGGPVAAQLLLTIVVSLLFWTASGPILGGGRAAGGSMQPFGGLVGMFLGAMVMPIFGYGDWIFAAILMIIAVLFGFLYAGMISGKT